jgi:hypothetical protein
LVEKIESELDQIVELLRTLVELESPSHRKDLVDQVGFMIAEHLGAQGLTPQVISREEVGDVIWAEWGEKEEGRILVLCHVDTVWEEGSLARNPFRVEEGRIYGPGVFDMKAGVAATLKIQQYLARGWIRPRRTGIDYGTTPSRRPPEDVSKRRGKLRPEGPWEISPFWTGAREGDQCGGGIGTTDRGHPSFGSA